MQHGHMLTPCAFLRAAAQLFAPWWRGLVLQQLLRAAKQKGTQRHVGLRVCTDTCLFSATHDTKDVVLMYKVGDGQRLTYSSVQFAPLI
jgi:hypothetical protein